MKKLLIAFLFSDLCLSVFIRGSICTAAPPAVTSLFPAGGQRGATVLVTATGTFDTWPVKAWTSDKAVTVTAGKEKGKLSVAVGADAKPGVCCLRLFDDTGASQLRPFVVGTLPDVAEVEPNEEPTKPQAIDKSVVVNGKLAKTGDVDVFAVKLKKGETLVAAVEAHHTLRSPMDSVLQIVSASGTVLEQNHDHRGLDPQLAFAAPADGTYLVRLFAFPSQPDSSIRHFGSEACVYRLTLTTGGVLDFVTPLAVKDGDEPAVTLHGWNVAEKSLRLGANDTVVHPKWSATCAAVLREPHPCHDFTKAKPDAPLTPPFTVTDRLSEPKATRGVAFAGSKGKPLAIRLDCASLGLPLTPVVRVFDDQGKQLAKYEPAKLNSDLEGTFTPPADGVYRLDVRDLHGGGGSRFAYRLRVVPVAPDFDLTVAADRFTVTPGKPLDVPVTVVRKNGFAGEVELTVEGLPMDVSVTPQKADAKGQTLRFEAKAGGFSGRIRVTGAAKNDAKLTRPATAAVTELDTATTHLWLTAIKKP